MDWIDVNARLPEPYVWSLVTDVDESGYRTIRIAYLSRDLIWQGLGLHHITAWRPEPEPYEGGKEK